MTVHLTPRQRDILPLIAEGYTNCEIADRVHLAAGTVKAHVERICDAFGARSRTHLVHLAHLSGVLGADPVTVQGGRAS